MMLPYFSKLNDITSVEKKIINFAYANIYHLLRDPLDKFIVAFMFDLGHSTETTAVACNLSRKTVWERKKKIRKMLKGLKLNGSLFTE